MKHYSRWLEINTVLKGYKDTDFIVFERGTNKHIFEYNWYHDYPGGFFSGKQRYVGAIAYPSTPEFALRARNSITDIPHYAVQTKYAAQ